jgi:hypothetical protein
LSVAESPDRADHLWRAVEETLRRHRFRLDRVDRGGGVITTLPETSQSFFEVWRRDVCTTRDWFEASLCPIRRWAEVRFHAGDDGRWNQIEVVVHKERLSTPDRQFNNAGAAYAYFGESLPSTTGAVRVTQEDMRWMDLGRDPAMEDRLLRLILEGAAAAEREANKG